MVTKAQIKQVMKAIGKKGGKAKTPAKLAAARKNGLLGGDPAKFKKSAK